jgi:hypothetical protein
MSQLVEEKKKRGRKKQNISVQVEEPTLAEDTKPIPKKRGRKPKGGKIIQQTAVVDTNHDSEPNVILHLKCSLKDIYESFQETYKYNPTVEAIQSFNFDNQNVSNFLIEENAVTSYENSSNQVPSCPKSMYTKCTGENIHETQYDADMDTKSIWTKIHELKVKLHKNDISGKRSACFWCTCEFDSPPIFIPKNEFQDTYQVYGCFCTPQCGTAYLMNEKIDSSVKFERYQLLNHVYGKIFNYEKNIKPAPDPHYILDKFYGTLSIKEYRDLLKNDQLLLIVEKPLTHVFPELYEDNSDFVLNHRTIPASNNVFKLKRKTKDSSKHE